MKKNVFFFLHILDLKLKISYQIVSLFDMYIDMGERIAGKQDRPSLIIGIIGIFRGLKINMGSNGKNFKVNFLKNCSITFFLFFA